MSQDQQTYRRGANAALIGLVAQIALGIAVALLGLYAQSPAINIAAWYIIGGIAAWIVLWLVYNQHRLERQEALEAEQLAESDAQAAAIFQEAGEQLALARRRLQNLYRWGLNVVSFLLGIYLLTMGLTFFILNYFGITTAEPIVSWRAGALTFEDLSKDVYARVLEPLTLLETTSVGLLALVFAVGFFLCFLIARYISGMTQVKEWSLLRGGAGYLMGNVVAVLLLGVAAVFAMLGNPLVFALVAIIIPAMMVVLAIEIFISLLLSIYRPRKSGEAPRAAFDSRALGWLSRPESIGKIVTETLNYQFGWEISRSWFYRLIGRAIAPLVLVTLVVMYALSCLVIVGPHQQAVITTLGAIGDPPRIVGPGPHFKWPWLIGHAEKFDVMRLHQIDVGSETREFMQAGVAILWTNQHTENKEQYMVTAPDLREEIEQRDEQSIAAGLAGSQMTVKFRIVDLGKYITSYREPEKVLRALAQREMNRFFVAHDIDSLLSTGRNEVNQQLRKQLGAELARHDLGIEIVFVGLQTIHPPMDEEVAAKFQEQIDAQQEKQTAINKAQTKAVGTLAAVAGSAERALAINGAISRLDELNDELEQLRRADQYDQARDAQLQELITKQKLQIENLLDDAGGAAAQAIQQARADRWETAIGAAAQARLFTAELRAYEQAPDYYRTRLYFEVLTEGLEKQRKFIIAPGLDEDAIYRMDLKTRKLIDPFAEEE